MLVNHTTDPLHTLPNLDQLSLLPHVRMDIVSPQKGPQIPALGLRMGPPSGRPQHGLMAMRPTVVIWWLKQPVVGG